MYSTLYSASLLSTVPSLCYSTAPPSPPLVFSSCLYSTLLLLSQSYPVVTWPVLCFPTPLPNPSLANPTLPYPTLPFGFPLFSPPPLPLFFYSTLPFLSQPYPASHSLSYLSLPYSVLKMHFIRFSILLMSLLYFCSLLVQLRHSSNILLKSRKILLGVIIPHLWRYVAHSQQCVLVLLHVINMLMKNTPSPPHQLALTVSACKQGLN